MLDGVLDPSRRHEVAEESELLRQGRGAAPTRVAAKLGLVRLCEGFAPARREAAARRDGLALVLCHRCGRGFSEQRVKNRQIDHQLLAQLWYKLFWPLRTLFGSRLVCLSTLARLGRELVSQRACAPTLQEMPSSKRVSVREAFASSGLDVPAPYLKNQTRGRDGEPCRRSVEEQSFTICASHALTWATRDGETVKTMSARDSAVIMGFDAAWRLPKGSRAAQKAVGNAMCVPMSRAIVQAAICLELGQPLPVAPAAPFQTPEPLSAAAAPVHGGVEYNKLKKRLRTIETLLRELHESVAAR